MSNKINEVTGLTALSPPFPPSLMAPAPPAIQLSTERGEGGVHGVKTSDPLQLLKSGARNALAERLAFHSIIATSSANLASPGVSEREPKVQIFN